MRWIGIFWWTSAFVAASLAGLVTYSTLKQASPVNSDDTTTTRPVVIAVADIPMRRSISAAEVTIREVPMASVPENAAISLDQVIGKMATVDLFANQPIVARQLVSPDVVTQQVALSIPPGKVVIVVPTQSKLISSQLLRAGDHIDLMATFDVEHTRSDGRTTLPESIALLQNLEVHAIILPMVPTEGELNGVDDEKGGVFRTADEGGQSILLAVDPKDALTIRHVLNVGGIIDLALRPPADESTGSSPVVDQFYLADRYKINLAR